MSFRTEVVVSGDCAEQPEAKMADSKMMKKKCKNVNFSSAIHTISNILSSMHTPSPHNTYFTSLTENNDLIS